MFDEHLEFQVCLNVSLPHSTQNSTKPYVNTQWFNVVLVVDLTWSGGSAGSCPSPASKVHHCWSLLVVPCACHAHSPPAPWLEGEGNSFAVCWMQHTAEFIILVMLWCLVLVLVTILLVPGCLVVDYMVLTVITAHTKYIWRLKYVKLDIMFCQKSNQTVNIHIQAHTGKCRGGADVWQPWIQKLLNHTAEYIITSSNFKCGSDVANSDILQTQFSITKPQRQHGRRGTQNREPESWGGGRGIYDAHTVSQILKSSICNDHRLFGMVYFFCSCPTRPDRLLPRVLIHIVHVVLPSPSLSPRPWNHNHILCVLVSRHLVCKTPWQLFL